MVEDQAPTSNLIRDVLVEGGFEVHVASSAREARETLKRALPSLVVLDRTLPDGDGLEILAELRRDERSTVLPVLILTARREVAEKVAGLRSGADDYLTKPFNTDELVARVEALLRRVGHAPAPPRLEGAGLRLERDSRRAFRGDKELPLSAKEFDLLWCLLEQANRVVTRDFLLQHVWGYEEGLDLTTKVVDVTVSHLRDKLGDPGSRIKAVRGFGYRLDL